MNALPWYDTPEPSEARQRELAAEIWSARLAAIVAIFAAGGETLAAYLGALERSLTTTRMRKAARAAARGEGPPPAPRKPGRGSNGNPAPGARTAELVAAVRAAEGKRVALHEACRLACAADLDADPAGVGLTAVRALGPSAARATVREYDLARGRAVAELRGMITRELFGRAGPYRALREHDLAGDLVAGAMEASLEAVGRYRPGDMPLGAWLKCGWIFGGAARAFAMCRPSPVVMLEVLDFEHESPWARGKYRTLARQQYAHVMPTPGGGAQPAFELMARPDVELAQERREREDQLERMRGAAELLPPSDRQAVRYTLRSGRLSPRTGEGSRAMLALRRALGVDGVGLERCA